MRKTGNDARTDATARLWETLFLLGFGVALLAFLSAIEHPGWFHIRPASGSAMAMSYSSDHGVKPGAGGKEARD